MNYAKGTTVSAERSLAEIKKLVAKHGGTAWKYGEDDEKIIISFELKTIKIRLEQSMPQTAAKEFAYDERSHRRTPLQSRAAYDAEVRRRWRVLLLRLKVRLEMIAEGVETVEQAFTAYLVGPDNTTVEQSLLPILRATRALPAPKEPQ